MIPFFVADRPMSLRALKGLPLASYLGVRIGIMAHANTTENFQNAIRRYPCENLSFCDAVGGPCQYPNDRDSCPARRLILERTVKMSDSGIFTREGARLSYRDLFATYKRMGVEYGIMIDVFQDVAGTLESARLALKDYEEFKDSFKLVGVAHGHTVDEYVGCYLSLKEMGFDLVAVGGLLARRDNTVRYPYVRNGSLMRAVLRELRGRNPDDWLFALGVLHPRRIGLLIELEAWADYKGWIFQYEKRSVTLTRHLQDLGSLCSDDVADRPDARTTHELARLLTVRAAMVARLQTKRAALQASSLQLRQALFGIATRIPEGSAMRARMVTLSSHALLDPAEERLVRQALRDLGQFDSEPGQEIVRLVHQTRTLKQSVLLLEGRIETTHRLIRTRLELLARSAHQPQSMKGACSRVIECIDRSEQDHRLQQVRSNIAGQVLAPLVKAG